MNETERLNALKNDYLEHYGVKGMKWGVLRSREELGYKDTPKKKKTTGFVQSLKKKRQAKLKAKAKAEAVKMEEAAKKAAEKVAKKDDEDAAIRERALRGDHKDLDFVYKNRHLLSNRELEDTLKRINTERALKKMIDDRPSDFDKAMKTIKKISGTMDDIYGVWDSKSMKAIRKALGGEDPSKMDSDSKDKKPKEKEQTPDRRAQSLDYVRRNWQNMSDSDLSAAINRLNSEATVRRLLSQRAQADYEQDRRRGRGNTGDSGSRDDTGRDRNRHENPNTSQRTATQHDLQSWERTREAQRINRQMDDYLSRAEELRRRTSDSNRLGGANNHERDEERGNR